MKKSIILLCSALLPTFSAFAYSSYDHSISGLAIFSILLMIAYIVLSVVILIRWWKMTADVKEIKEHITKSNSNPKLTYLIAIGETEQAEKDALAMMVNNLMPIYYDRFCFDKANMMNNYISTMLPKINKLGIQMPDYVTSGEKFIAYLNALTGNNVPLRESAPSYGN